MKVLVINSGSSSMKYQLFEYEGRQILAKGIAERIGIEEPLFSYKRGDGFSYKKHMEIKTHRDAVNAMVAALTDPENGVISDLSEVKAVGHRVLHGGEYFAAPVQINEEVKAVIKKCFAWGPLHNPANLMGIEVCEEVMAGIPQVAVFDTAFHQTMPPKAYRYALPEHYYKDLGIRRYGFHGTSHAFVAKEVAKFLGRDSQEGLRVITCHLGNGSSFAAVKDGKCIDTSMGLTPLSGIAMGTRCGDVDPAIVPYIQKAENLSAEELDTMMNKKSGMLAISKKSSDFRDLWEGEEAGDENCKLALEIFSYQAAKLIASYAAALKGVDAIVFTGGVGENDFGVREMACDYLAFMGVELDLEKNNGTRDLAIISTPESKVKVIVLPTNEELSICEQAVEVLGLA
ncbi:MAG: acetate kinase [Eubacteriales bacterium]|nr:acetate kinase [Eubacteriales bacterium]